MIMTVRIKFILTTIKDSSMPFTPINRAKTSSVVIAYFINYTDPLPEECSLGTYPWKTYPRIYTLLYTTLRTVLYYYYNTHTYTYIHYIHYI